MRIRLQRLRAFGLRGRIVGAVLVTTVVTLGVAAVVLLPQLEQALRDASQTSLRNDLHGARAEVSALAKVDYRVATDLTIRQLRGTTLDRAARTAEQRLQDDLTQLRQRLGTDDVYLIGYVDASGHGRPVGLLPSTPSGIGAGATAGSFAGSAPDAAYTDAVADALAADNFDDVAAAFFHTTHFTAYLSFGQVAGAQVVRAAIPLPDDAVLAVRKSIDQIPAAVRAVDHAFEVAALAGLLLTALLAIPLAATLVRRLQRLREAAQRVAEEGAGAEVPTDRARDEVGDLARSFAIMQRRLVHQEEARRAFVATASHELRTPLASLEGMLELVAEDLSDTPDLEEANALLERARVQARRLSRLAADLLDLSRIDAEVPLRSEPVELGELARAVAAEFELRTAERRVSMRIGGNQPAWVLGDPGKVAQILRILLDNALRVSRDSSEITVTLNHTGLAVSDSGPGVAQEERELIFDRFKRGAATGGQAGFGLGLAIGRELARRMSGDLKLADSTDGATFVLVLAAAMPPTPIDAEPVAEETA